MFEIKKIDVKRQSRQEVRRDCSKIEEFKSMQKKKERHVVVNILKLINNKSKGLKKDTGEGNV